MPKHKLLLADDSATIQKVINLTFAEEGIDVATVGDGDAAWQQIAAEKPDIVLADVHMPGIGGYQLCEKIRANESMRDLPVILLVGSFEPFDEAEAQRVGANAHLTKPFQSIKQLVSQVKEMVAPPTDPVSFEETIQIDKEAEQIDQGEIAENPPEPLELGDVPPPEKDVSDIDALYTQSLEETVEIPQNFAATEALMDVSSDDELIETRTAATGFEEPAADVIPDDTEGPAVPVAPEPEMLSQAANGQDGSAEGFDTVEIPAAETPAETEPEPVGGISPFASTVPAFEDGDLLDIPTVTAVPAAPPDTPDSPEPAKLTVDISPEMLELIVQKVIERLEEKREPSPDSAFR